MQNDFRVAAGLELGAGRFQLRHQVRKIIDLAIEDDGERLVGRRHGLDAARQVDEGQPPMPQGHAWRIEDALAVRTAMGDPHPSSPGSRARSEVPLATAIEQAGQTAHNLLLSL